MCPSTSPGWPRPTPSPRSGGCCPRSVLVRPSPRRCRGWPFTVLGTAPYSTRRQSSPPVSIGRAADAAARDPSRGLTLRIGVVADTHCPEFMDRLPDRVFEVLRGVDLIIHAGDVNGPGTIAALSALAPVEVVRGDHDLDKAGWPLSKEVTVEGKRIVIVHGNRSRWVEEPQTLLWTVSLGAYHPHSRLARVLRARFANADAIVFGHTHRSLIETLDGTLMFNPRAVPQWNPPPAPPTPTPPPA